MDKKKILIIDDEPHFCKLVKKNIEQIGGFEVYTATNGEEGIRLAKEIRPGLILLDVVMPEMDGVEVLSRIKGEESIKNTPVVFLTGIIKEEEAGIQASFSGGYSFLAKTVTVGELIACISKNIR